MKKLLRYLFTILFGAQTLWAFQQVFIFGLGYTGLGIANVIRKNYPDCVVSGTCRSEEKMESLRNLDIDAHCFDLDGEISGLDDAGKMALLSSSHVISTISPIWDIDDDPVLHFHGNDLKCSKPWLGYLSTTGVYGNHDGEWVTETSSCLAPKISRAFPRLAVESKWMNLLSGDSDGDGKAFVFRLSGIYGPGRSALATIKKDSAFQYGEEKGVSKTCADNQRGVQESTPNYVNRIHVGDIADAVVAAMEIEAEECPYGIYNLSDDDPTPRREVMAFARDLMSSSSTTSSSSSSVSSSSLPLPTSDEAPREPSFLKQSEGTFKPTLGARAARRVKENKRVANNKMKQAGLLRGMGGRLRYPSFREGLTAEHAGETYPF